MTAAAKPCARAINRATSRRLPTTGCPSRSRNVSGCASRCTCPQDCPSAPARTARCRPVWSSAVFSPRIRQRGRGARPRPPCSQIQIQGAIDLTTVEGGTPSLATNLISGRGVCRPNCGVHGLGLQHCPRHRHHVGRRRHIPSWCRRCPRQRPSCRHRLRPPRPGRLAERRYDCAWNRPPPSAIRSTAGWFRSARWCHRPRREPPHRLVGWSRHSNDYRRC
jgi:hypothetical protein